MLLALIVIFATASIICAQPIVTGRVADIQNPADEPYRSAVLTVDNKSSFIIRAVRLRCRTGGATIIIPASIAPGVKADFKVALPVVSSSQVYRAELLEEPMAGAESFATSDVRIIFPGELLANEVIFDEQAYGDFQGDYPTWSAGLLSTVMIGAILAVLALAAGLLVSRPMLKLTLLAIIVIAAGVTAWFVMDDQQTLVIREFPSSDKTTGSLVVVTCRRGDTFKTDETDLKPIYENPGQMQNCETTIVVGKSLSCPIKPNQILLFRKGLAE